MPYRHKSAGKPRKSGRKYRPRYKRKSRSVTFSRGPSAMADATRVRLKYHDSFVMTAAGTPAIHVYRTSLFDPDESGGGHQPMGFDEYGAFYQRYRVSGIAYKIWFINTSTAEQCDVAVVTKPNATAITTSNQLWEQPYSRPRVLGVEGGNSMTFMKGYMSASKILGVSKARYKTDDIFTALWTGDPARSARIHLYAQPSNLTSTSTVRVKIDLTFYATLFDRHTLSTS